MLLRSRSWGLTLALALTGVTLGPVAASPAPTAACDKACQWNARAVFSSHTHYTMAIKDVPTGSEIAITWKSTDYPDLAPITYTGRLPQRLFHTRLAGLDLATPEDVCIATVYLTDRHQGKATPYSVDLHHGQCLPGASAVAPVVAGSH
jgi:hypothetical protein